MSGTVRTRYSQLLKPGCAVSGDAAARALVKKLLKAGCQPYFQMLEKWLCEGDLDDPFQEFMVCQDSVSCWLAPSAITPTSPCLLTKLTPAIAQIQNKAAIC